MGELHPRPLGRGRRAAVAWPAEPVPATFRGRLNRFAADTSLGRCHVPSSGRLAELLVPGADIWLLPAPGGGRAPARRTAWDLLAVHQSGGWVCIDTRVPGRLVRPLLPAHARPEVRWGSSRFDFAWPGGLCEVKSVTLVEAGVALFPDAPTARGTRHLRELAAACREGLEARLYLVVQRSDANLVRPHHEHDPAFAAALVAAKEAGVAVHAFTCRVTRRGISPLSELPVEA